MDIGQRVVNLYVRFREEFPEFTPDEAWGHAERVAVFAEQAAFQFDVERDIAALPTTLEVHA